MVVTLVFGVSAELMAYDGTSAIVPYLVSPGKTIFESDNSLFSLLTMNHHPLHIDDNYCKETDFGQILVCGPLVISTVIGMSVSDILVSATVNAADLIGKSQSTGTITKGKTADIIAMNSSPFDDIKALLDVNFVMKTGVVVKSN